MFKKLSRLSALLVILSMLITTQAFANGKLSPAADVTFTILHTNDFHGQLEAANATANKASNPGYARTAYVINAIRTTKGAANVLLVDSGDEMQGSLLSNLGDGTPTGKGAPTIDVFNTIGYNAATFGNHEFDWGQVVLGARTTQATYPYVTANIVQNDGVGGSCASAGWTLPTFADAAYTVATVGTSPNAKKVAFIGVTTTETPTITIASATAGLCFKDPAESIAHYYAAMKAEADVIVVLSHLGLDDGGYGYGIPVYGDKTLAGKLNTAGKPVDLIIGGHSHSTVYPPLTKVGNTSVVQAYYNGRAVGDAEVTVSSTGAVTIAWQPILWKIPSSGPPPTTWFGWKLFDTSTTYTDFANESKDPTIDALITSYASDPDYLAIVNEPVGYSAVDLPRSNTTDNMMGTFIDDAIYNYLNTDDKPANDVDLFFNNAGGIRADWCYVTGSWTGTGCTPGLHDAGLLTYGNMFTVLPFGNATIVGSMTGAQILEVLNYAPNVAGVIQPAGLKYKYYSYKTGSPSAIYAWGAFDVTIYNKTTTAWEALDLKKTYKVGTNEFLAPAGGDGYNGFKYMTNITYWGDMLNAVNAYVKTNYTQVNPYKGPNGDGSLDGRIIRDGTDAPDSGSILPITILHHNDSHGNLVKTPYVAYTQLATLINAERAKNPTRTILLNGGDTIQGDAMMYYFRTAPQGFTSNGTPLAPAQSMNPIIKVMNAMNYDGFLLGNHEFNFGSEVFRTTMAQATMPILGANVSDSGAYGLNDVQGGAGVKESIQKDFPGKTPGDPRIKVGILGLTNHRVPNYELPSNIPGLTFTNPLEKATALVPGLKAVDDAVIALTHIGFTTNPANVEVDTNVDTYLAATVGGIDAILGAHSHTNPAYPETPFKFLPTIVAGPEGAPVMITNDYRYNTTLGKIVLGMRAKAGGGYEVAARAGNYQSVSLASTAEDAAIKAIVDPYATLLTAYMAQPLGSTTVPLDALKAFTQETNAANLQADASVYELALHGIKVDFHISGAMTNKAVALTATPALPTALGIQQMFDLMPYENSLVVMLMNGPQLKTVLERGYRNYYYYKYVAGRGGYSYYTTCMLDINKGGNIKYAEGFPNGYNVRSLTFNGNSVDFTDATKFYYVSTVNYLAAGSCNFNNAGQTLWPLTQIVYDTQYYVRDATIDYIKAAGIVSPKIEGRLTFNYLNFLPLQNVEPAP
jgi:2',3'-cyclic-nucleotide 2'-phosphodiesterase (5'-nucleotidase family)